MSNFNCFKQQENLFSYIVRCPNVQLLQHCLIQWLKDSIRFLLSFLSFTSTWALPFARLPGLHAAATVPSRCRRLFFFFDSFWKWRNFSKKLLFSNLSRLSFVLHWPELCHMLRAKLIPSLELKLSKLS